MNIFILYYSHKHGVDITAYKSKDRAILAANSILAEWHPDTKSYQEIVETSFGEESVEIFETLLEE